MKNSVGYALDPKPTRRFFLVLSDTTIAAKISWRTLSVLVLLVA